MSLLWMLILFMIFEPSHQKRYLCDPNLKCGCSMKPASLARIVGGEEADKGTWGWAVSLHIRTGKGVSLCGGSILSSSWIITAAHCLKDISPSHVMVYAGSNILWSGTQNRRVSQIIVHSDYISDTFVNDIALLRLAFPLNMDDSTVSSICLPSVSSSTLAAGEWPPPKTTVSIFYFYFSIIILIVYC
jgi:secreted trypsin-like serine protease